MAVDGDARESLEDVADDVPDLAPPPAPDAPSGDPALLPPPPGLPPTPRGPLVAVSPEARLDAAPPAPSRVTPRPVAADVLGPAAEVLTTVERAGSAKARFAALAPVEGGPLSGEDLVAIVRAMPDGWQRRTAARRLLTRSAVTDVDAEALVTSLGRQGDRNAVASLLVETGGAHVETVVDQLDARTADRLRRRAARDA